jgi:hypothetical protein
MVVGNILRFQAEQRDSPDERHQQCKYLRATLRMTVWRGGKLRCERVWQTATSGLKEKEVDRRERNNDKA